MNALEKIIEIRDRVKLLPKSKQKEKLIKKIQSRISYISLYKVTDRNQDLLLQETEREIKNIQETAMYMQQPL